MKYVFVGDLHGRWEAIDRALSKPHDKLIFLGDMFDSFDRTVKDQFKTFYMVKELVESGEAECVWANHEWSYLHYGMSCSGYNAATYARKAEFEPTVRNLFKPYLYLEDSILVTHAGLTAYKFNKASIEMLDQWSQRQDLDSPYFHIGRARGGRMEYGGPLWCDWNKEFEPIEGLVQVVGHTYGQGIRQKGNSFCVDCVDNTMEFLTIDT